MPLVSLGIVLGFGHGETMTTRQVCSHRITESLQISGGQLITALA